MEEIYNCDYMYYYNNGTDDSVSASHRQAIITVYLGTLVVVGTLGNAALVKYLVKWKRTTHRALLLGLALSDLIVCSVTVPFEIFDFNHKFTFHSAVACKFFRTVNYSMIFVSVLMLLSLSLDRFLRVCKPLCVQINVRGARIMIFINICIASLFSWPNIIFYGIRRIHLPRNLTGYDCTTLEEYAFTKYTLIYSVLLAIMFIAFFVILVVFYGMIGIHVFRHIKYRKHFIQMQSNNYVSNVSRTQSSQSSDVTSSKTTKILFLISTVFVISYSPFLVVSILEPILGRCFVIPNSISELIFRIVERSYIFNHVANPFIYGFVDKTFRVMVKNMMTICFTRRT